MLALAASAGVAIPAAGPSIEVARGGTARLPIVLAVDALPAERTAAEELAAYLERITGARFDVRVEDPETPVSAALWVGPTAAAREAGIDPGGLAEEAWIVRSVPDAGVLVVGGRPRGTLYAVYHLLEDALGVRWWTPFEETVPERRSLLLSALDLAGEPEFAYRDVAGIDGPRAFCARNRVNGHKAGLTWTWGGTIDYGPPKQVHDFFEYFPPEEWFDSDPELFSEIGGVRYGADAQLCLTHPRLDDLVTERMLEYIRAAKHTASLRGVPAPRLFDFSQNDWGYACSCETCRAGIARDGGGHAALLIDLVNRVADRVGERHPSVLVDTLAYNFTFDPPRRVVARDNVVVRLSALYQRDFSRAVRDPANRAYLDALAGWQDAAKHLRIWDYTVIFGPDGDLPLPNLGHLADDLRTYRDHGVEGLFVQHAHPISGDLRDLKLWVLLKLLEDPARDPAALIETFTDGYYGSAGRWIRRYAQHLEAAAAASDARIRFSSDREDFTYVDTKFARRAHRLFDRAEQAVRSDPEKLRRVRHARLSLDRATLLRRLPGFDRVRVAQRYRDTAEEQIELRADPATRDGLREAVDREIAAYLLD